METEVANRETEGCRVAILVGGMGTRLQARAGNLPKPMVPLLGRPVLAHQIELCRTHGFSDIALLVHHLGDAIRDHFGDGTAHGVRLTYCTEEAPRGTAGALRDALPVLAEQFLVLYGDTYFDVDLARLWSAHRPPAAATLFLHPNDHPHDSDLVELDPDRWVRAVHPYPHPKSQSCANLVNAALYVFAKSGLEAVLPETGKADLAKDTFPAMIERGDALRGYVSQEYIKDMGTPDRLDKVAGDIAAELPDRLSLRQPRRAVFLDRDGTLNDLVGHLSDAEQLTLLEGAGSAVRRLNRAGVLAVVTTNQPVLARGKLSAAGLGEIHARLDQLLGEQGAYVDRLYFCPHHPHRGYPGEVAELKIDCTCRKPRAGMIEQAVHELYIDRRRSWAIGDTSSDIAAGAEAGVGTILLRTGEAGLDGKYPVCPDYVFPDLPAAVDWIVEGHGAATRRALPLVPQALEARVIAIGGNDAAGRRHMAQVLAELLRDAAPSVHIVHAGADGVQPPITDLVGIRSRMTLELPQPDPYNPAASQPCRFSIGLDDIVILEATSVLDEATAREVPMRVWIDATTKAIASAEQRERAWRTRAGVPANQARDRNVAAPSPNAATHILAGILG